MPLSRTNKILTGIVIIALIAAVAVLVYAYAPKGGNQNQNPSTKAPDYVLINIQGQDQPPLNISYKKLDQMSQLYEGAGGYRTNGGTTKIGNYTGISFKELALQMTGNNTNFAMKAVTGDGKTFAYSRDQTKGINITRYDTIDRTESVNLVLIYKSNGQLLNGTSGHFMLGYLNTDWKNPPITPAELWPRDVRTITLQGYHL
jgi:hypothetical protein